MQTGYIALRNANAAAPCILDLHCDRVVRKVFSQAQSATQAQFQNFKKISQALLRCAHYDGTSHADYRAHAHMQRAIAFHAKSSYAI
jgi:hypothetical protein